MKYRNYGNSYYYGLIGILCFFLFGGLTILRAVIPIIFKLIPMILIGCLIFLFIKRIVSNMRISDTIQGSTLQNQRFIELLIHILIKVAQSDGHVSPVEIQTIKSFFRMNLQFSDQKMIWISDLIQHAQTQSLSLAECCTEFRSLFSQQSRLIALQLVYRVIMADHVVADSEQAIVETIVRMLHISETEHQSIRSFFKADQTKDDHFSILGITPGSSPAAIKKAYRKACKEHHPDRVHHLGPELKKVAEEKMRKINASYDILTKGNR